MKLHNTEFTATVKDEDFGKLMEMKKSITKNYKRKGPGKFNDQFAQKNANEMLH